MTIKQLGGVFGRNPTFNDVTIEGELTFDGDIDINSDLKIDGNLEVTGTSTLNGLTTITKSSGEQLSLVGWSWTNGANGSSGALELGPNAAYQAQIGYAADGNTTLSFDNTYSSDNAKTQFRMKTAGSAVVPLTIYGSGNVELSNNLVMASGQGIDFSATAGTGTSELLDDYEEGDWTPTLQATDGAVNSVTYDTLTGGKYTKIGNVVHVQCYMRTDALDNTVGRSGDVVIEGLPFASVTASAGINGHCAFSVGITSAFAGENPSMSFVGGGGQTAIQLMYQTTADGNTSNLKPSDLGTGINSNIVLVSGTYTSA
jgi:hypothetical protein